LIMKEIIVFNIVQGVLLHLLENTFDRKRISANPNPYTKAQ